MPVCLKLANSSMSRYVAGCPHRKKRFYLLTDYFQKLEAAVAHLNNLAFMGSSQLDVEQLMEQTSLTSAKDF